MIIDPRLRHRSKDAKLTGFHLLTVQEGLDRKGFQLLHLRGDGMIGELQKHDSVYGYSYYNVLGHPNKGLSFALPVLGGSVECPYPCCGPTNQPPNRADSSIKSRWPLLDLDIYVPRDEQFGHRKMAEFIRNTLKAVDQALAPTLKVLVDQTSFEFDSFQ